MTTEMMLAMFGWGVALFMWYAQYQLKGKILCTFRRKNKTKVDKLIKSDSKIVQFGGQKYEVDTRRIVMHEYKKGLHQFFPTLIPSLDFRWDSASPLNPEDFQNTWDTPEARQVSANQDAYQAFAKGVSTEIQGKKKMAEYLPLIILGGIVAVVGYLVYQMMGEQAYMRQLLETLINSGAGN